MVDLARARLLPLGVLARVIRNSRELEAALLTGLHTGKWFTETPPPVLGQLAASRNPGALDPSGPDDLAFALSHPSERWRVSPAGNSLRQHPDRNRGGIMTSVVRLGMTAGLLIALGGCASITPIGDLLNNPARYDGKTVKIEGEVREAVGGLGLGAFQVRDNTGTIPVISQTSPPPTGARVGVKGKFESLFTFGTKSLAVLREESRFSP